MRVVAVLGVFEGSASVVRRDTGIRCSSDCIIAAWTTAGIWCSRDCIITAWLTPSCSRAVNNPKLSFEICMQRLWIALDWPKDPWDQKLGGICDARSHIWWWTVLTNIMKTQSRSNCCILTAFIRWNFIDVIAMLCFNCARCWHARR